jgi:hypothetical protein
LTNAHFEDHTEIRLSRTLSTRKVLLLVALGLLLVAPLFLSMPRAEAAVTINQGLGAGSATGSAFANQGKVFYVQYVASPLSYRWWAFYATSTGITYQSSLNGQIWSGQATLSALGDSSYGGAFSAYLSGSTLYYAIASASGTTLYYGKVTLAASGTATPVTSGSLTTTNAMTGASTTSIAVDSSGYTWVSVTTSGTVEVWACKGTLGSCTWLAQGPASGSSTFALVTPYVGSASSQLLVTGGSVVLIYVQPHLNSAYGPMEIYSLSSVGAGYVAWAGPVSPFSEFYQENYFSAVASGSTVYVTGDMAGFVTAFNYQVGGAVSAEIDVISSVPGTYEPTLSLSGGGNTLVMAIPTGSSVAYYTDAIPGTTAWTPAGNLTPPRFIAENTENGPQYVVSTAGDNGSSNPSIGYLWTNGGGQMRFSTLDLTPVPVSVTLSLTEYVLLHPPQVQTPKVSAANFYTISYYACVPSCSSATLTTVHYTSSTGAPLTITNVASQTPVTISGTTSGSSVTEQWCLNQACAATVFGASDGITTSWVYYDLLAETSKYSVVGGVAPSAPTIIYEGASGSSGNTGTPAGYSATMTTTSVTYWMLRNSTSSATAALAGLPGEQWAAGGVGDTVAWTATSANIITANIVYYHQYQNTYTITQAGSATSFPANTQFALTGTLFGANGIIYTFTGTGSLGALTVTLWTDAGYTVTFPQTATAGVPAGTRWIDSTGSAFMTGVINSGNNPTVTQSYYEQYSQILQYNTKDGSVMPTVPQLTYTTFGVVTPYTITGSAFTIWMDANTPATIPGHAYGGLGERWVTKTFAWTITATNLIPNPIVYYHQYQQQVSYSTNDGVAIGTVPVFTYTNNGTVYTGGTGYTLTLVAHLLYADAATAASVPGQICSGACGSATQEWVTAPSSWSITGYEVVDSGSGGQIPYSHQFQITLAVSPAGTGTTSPVAGTPVWETTLTPFSIIGSFNPNYAFSTWSTSSGTITVANPSAASTTASVAAAGPAGTITANFILQSGLQFIETGLNLNGPSWDVIITSYVGSGTFVCPTGPGLPCTVTSTTSGIFLSGIPVGVYGYTVPSPQPWAAGIQYVVTSVLNGNPGTISVNPSSNEPITFQAQYYLTTAQLPVSSGTITVNGVNCVTTPNACWFTSGTSITLVATATAPGAAFSSWTVPSGCTPNCNVASITTTMPTNPETATANFVVPISISVSPASMSAGLGSVVQATVTVAGGTGTITLSNSALQAGITVAYSPLSFPANGAGATSTMTVTVSPNAQYGIYTWNVIATDSHSNQATTTFQLDIISPTVTTIGFTTSAYAITYGSQSALFFANNHWFVVYSDGTNLIYRSSTDATGTVWNAQSIIATGITQGYSFSVGSWLASGTYYVGLALMTSSDTGHFYYVQGPVAVAGLSATINWAACAGSCGLGPISMQKLSLPAGLTAEGSPNLYVDTSSGANGCATISPTGVCVWVTVPALDSTLMWHVEVFSLTSSWSGPTGSSASFFVPKDDVPLHQVYTGPDSQVHAEIYSMPDALATIFVVGTTPDLPHITVFSHGDAFVSTFCVGGQLVAGVCPAPPGSWSGIRIYEQQSQGAVMPAVAGTDIIFFAALSTNGAPGAVVEFYTFNYNSVTPGLSTFSAPTLLPISSIPANAVVNHSWHVSMTFGGSSVYLAYGVDDFLGFEVGTVGSAPSYTVAWSAPIQVPGVVGLVGGVTVSYSGSTVGLVWVQTSGTEYAVKFAII